MYYVGLDVHRNHSCLHILDEKGQKINRATVRGGWDRLIERLRETEGPLSICYEASLGCGALYDRLSALPHVRRVAVAHPGNLRVIFGSKRKNDRVDAAKLALLLLVDQVPEAWVPGLEVREWRRLIERRRTLVEKRTRCKNALRSLLNKRGIRAPRGLWTKKGRAWLRDLELRELAALERDELLEEIELLEGHIDRATRRLDAIGRDHPGVMLLRSIPGVGPRTAEAVVAYIDKPSRFGSARQVGAYFGLVPKQEQSGNVNRLGHITKEGPATARKLLIEAAWQAIRRSECCRAYYERVRRGRDERKKIALVATAHHLLRCMQGMLRSGEAWREAA